MSVVMANSTWHWNFLRTLARYRFSTWTCYLDGIRRLYFLFSADVKTGLLIHVQ